MKVFISWSGEISHKVGIVLHGWLPSVIQALKPYISTEDIAKGTRGIAVISEALEHSSFGILCLTKDNIHAPWLNFEAGALSKSVEGSRVAPFLFGIKRSEIKEGPITQFQSTIFDKADIRNLLDSLNTAEGTPLLDKSLLDDTFDTWWPKLEDKLNEIKVPEPEAEEGTSSFQGKPADTSLHEVKNLVAEGVAKGVAEGLKKFAEINAEAVSKNPKEAAAVLLQRQGKIEEAIEQWRSIATVAGEEDRPLQARAWFSIGYLRSVGEGIDLEAAVDAYTKAIELDPTLAVAYGNRGSAKDDRGQPAAALADFDRAIELDPTLAVAYFNRGNAKRSLGRHDAAFADYDQAIELEPTYAEAYNNRGYAKYARGQHDAAFADLDRAIELNPTLATAYDSRGEMKHALGRHDAALADLDRAIELNPTLVDAYYNRGNTKRSLGRISEARADYQQALVLAQEARDEKLVAKVKDALHRLDNR